MKPYQTFVLGIACVVTIVLAGVACQKPYADGKIKERSERNRVKVSKSRDAAHSSLASDPTAIYVPPDTSTIPHDYTGNMIRYGRELIVNFPYYLGPNGKVGKYGGNALGCQSCHLDAGTRPYGLNYFSAHARYPQYRAREGQILTLADRVNNCVVRPLNGRPLPLESKEMTAIVTYMKWLGAGVPVNGNVEGDALKAVALIDRPTDPEKGRVIYNIHCMRCHGDDGQGKLKADNMAYEYPPLWGKLSYQPGSSMHRVIKAAQFIKYNMPFDLARWDKPILTDEEALDVASFINDDRQHVRPQSVGDHDYPLNEEKPVDFWKPPFKDPFSKDEHKFGPFKPIIAWRKANKQTTGY